MGKHTEEWSHVFEQPVWCIVLHEDGGIWEVSVPVRELEGHDEKVRNWRMEVWGIVILEKSIVLFVSIHSCMD